ncbi:NAD(P)-dependent oxidoreductase [Flectobacillus major]|jgi:D-3-phosphoglycerate dehydrogenase|uniref:NAD(P)-dependent oxidoreductase n=1 Tax=Flectobacillus major TaxID=103 RepID=UPI0004143149|nr:NAD(P)-dependent oxidoreductase [Flectobacillus major]
MNKSVLIADEMHPSIMYMMESLGLVPDYQPQIKRAELLANLHQYDGLIIRSKTPIDKEILDTVSHLRFIARAGAGLDLIDIEEAQKKNIQIFAANEGNRDAVAEHVIGMILCLFNKINTADIEVRQKFWKREANRGIELMGKTIGLIGYGNMGQSVAQRLSGFGVKVLAYDKYKTGFSNQFVEEASMEEIFEQTDVLSLHIPLTDETRYLVTNDYIKQFKKDIFLINTSRGEIASIQCIVKGLNTGKLKGACLDVLENEKMNKLSPEQEILYEVLFQMKNVILTPHVAGWTAESYEKINQVLFEKIKLSLAQA